MNKRLKVFIAEDDVFISEQLNDILQELGYETQEIGFDYDSSIEILSKIQPDIAILDIKMHGNDEGLRIAEYINKHHMIPFVFLTSFSDQETVDAAISLNPSAYLVKPFKKSDIFATLEVVKKKKQQKDTILVKNGWENTQLKISDILWVKADDKYIEIYTKRGKYVQRLSIKKFRESTNSQWLVQTHRSYLVNVGNVSGFTSTSVYIEETEIPLSRTHRSEFEIVFHRNR